MEEEELKQIKQTLNDLTVKIDEKIEELSKQLGNQWREKRIYRREIGENPLAYMAGAFVGGMIVVI